MRPVLFIYPKTNPFPHSVSIPLSVFCLGSYLERQGVGVEYFDERISPRKDLIALLKEADPLLVCVSAMTGYQIRRGLDLSATVRRYRPAVPIAWGGVHPSMQPEQTLASPYVDFVVRGEGEATLGELCRKLAAGEDDFSAVAGLSWKNEGRLLANPDRDFLDVNTLPFPYSGKAMESLKAKYLTRSSSRPVVGYQVVRGCASRCSFCFNAFHNKSRARVMDREKYSRELRMLKDLGVKDIYFYDSNLGVSKSFLAEFCGVMKEMGMTWSANIRVNVVDEKTLKALAGSGCNYLCVGLDAVTDEQLDRIQKDQTMSQVRECVRLMARWREDIRGINKFYSFICGLPGEEKGYLDKILDFCDWIRESDPRASIAIQPYAPLPGTPLYEEAQQHGFVPPRELSQWWDFTTGDVVGPWVRDKNLLRNVFLVSFLVSRYGKFIHAGFYPLHSFARFRWRHRFFRLCFERTLFRLMKACYILADRWAV